MEREINYLISGRPHLPYLITSLFTLRNHWKGPVVVHAWEESFDIVESIAQDERLWGDDSIRVGYRVPAWRGRNAQFLDKIRMVMESDADVVLYLDADTTIHGDLTPLFDQAEKCGFCATQFCEWTTHGLAGNRIKRLKPYPEIPQDHVQAVLDDKLWPSVNGGVWAAKPSSPVLPDWYKWTDACKEKVFIADEAVLHVCSSVFCPQGKMSILLGGAFNCSPMRFQPETLQDEDVRIRHFHGDSNVRPDKSPKGHKLWWPIWQECLEKNIGGCAGWKATDIGNKRMDKLQYAFRGDK